MGIKIISPMRAKKLCAIPDLTDHGNGIHAINLTLDRIIDGFVRNNTYPNPTTFRSTRVMPVEHNFDRLLFPQEAAVRTSLHTLYISKKTVLRSQTSSLVPLAINNMRNTLANDIILCCPGVCFRNSRKGALHSSEPHQVDIWRLVRANPQLSSADLQLFVRDIVVSIFNDPNVVFECTEVMKDTSTSHPYLSRVFKIRIPFLGNMISIGEAGVVNTRLLRSLKLEHADYSAVAVGIMLDRAVMAIKNIHDIRLLRSENPVIAKQMGNLDPFTPVSKFPSATRDLSIVLDTDTTLQSIEACAQQALGDDSHKLTSVVIAAETPYTQLPQQAIERLGISSHQKNVLIRLTFQLHDRTLRKDEVNALMECLIHAFGVLNVTTGTPRAHL